MLLALSPFQLLVEFLGKRLLASSYQSVRMEHFGFHFTHCREVGYFGIFRKSVEKIQAPLKSGKNNLYFT
jgi:hypothetical protein